MTSWLHDHIPKKKRRLKFYSHKPAPLGLHINNSASASASASAVRLGMKCHCSQREFNEEEEEQAAAKKPKTNTNPPPPQAVLPPEFHAQIQLLGGDNILLVLQKRLFKTHLTTTTAQFSIPSKQTQSEFLSQEEKRKLHGKQAIQVRLIEPCLCTSFLLLKCWTMDTSAT